MSGAAIICDTGALLDFLVRASPDHAFFKSAFETAGTRFIPGLVLAEVDYSLRDQRVAMRGLIDDIDRGAFIYTPPTVAELARALDIDAAYPELKLGLVDASIVALAEELDVVRLATRDVRDFAAVRLADGRAFELVTVGGAPTVGGPASGSARPPRRR